MKTVSRVSRDNIFESNQTLTTSTCPVLPVFTYLQLGFSPSPPQYPGQVLMTPFNLCRRASTHQKHPPPITATSMFLITNNLSEKNIFFSLFFAGKDRYFSKSKSVTFKYQILGYQYTDSDQLNNTHLSELMEQIRRPLLEEVFKHKHEETLVEIYHGELRAKSYKNDFRLGITMHLCFEMIRNENKTIGVAIYLPEPLFFWKEDWLGWQLWRSTLLHQIPMKGSCSMVEIQETLGSGSFATVQLAQVEHLPSSVAVKHFTRKEYRENESRELINNEIRMLRKCNHSSIVGFHGVLKTDNRIYLIMEKVEGISLQKMFVKGVFFNKCQRRQIMLSLLEGLAELKKHHIVHRDLKPANVMVTSEFKVKIIDFGLAISLDENSHQYVKCGTPGYIDPSLLKMPNEREEEYQFDYRGDIFGAGAILYEMMFRRRLFLGRNTREQVKLNKQCKVKFNDRLLLKIKNFNEFDLLSRMLVPKTTDRISVEDAMVHPYFNEK